MGLIQYKNLSQTSFADLMVYNTIPPHPFWDGVAKHIDFSFADKLCEPLYSHLGQRPYAPSLKLKIHLVQRYYNISDREMELKIIGDIFVKRFLGLPVDHNTFDHSTIALDRGRLGAEMFHACHWYILAQAHDLGLWGDKDDRWLVDAFHTYANVATSSTYELIQQAAQQIVRHLKKKNSAQYEHLKKDIDVGFFFRRLKRDTESKQRHTKFSEMVVQSYGLVAWLDNSEPDSLFPWNDIKDKVVSKERCALLLSILRQNAAPVDGNNEDELEKRDVVPQGPDNVHEDQTNDSFQYVELSKERKPSDRVVSAYAPDVDVRWGRKSKKVVFLGDKIQVVESSKSRLILNAEPIAGNEDDGKALVELVQTVIEEQGIHPKRSCSGFSVWFRREPKCTERSIPAPHRSDSETNQPNWRIVYKRRVHLQA